MKLLVLLSLVFSVLFVSPRSESVGCVTCVLPVVACGPCMASPPVAAVMLGASVVSLGLGVAGFWALSEEEIIAIEKAKRFHYRSEFFRNYDWSMESGLSLGSTYQTKSSYLSATLSKNLDKFTPFLDISLLMPKKVVSSVVGLNYYLNKSVKFYSEFNYFGNSSYLSLGAVVRKTFTHVSVHVGLDYTKALKGKELEKLSEFFISPFVYIDKSFNLPYFKTPMNAYLSSFVLDRQFTTGLKYSF